MACVPIWQKDPSVILSRFNFKMTGYGEFELFENNVISKDYILTIGSEDGIKRLTRRPSARTFEGGLRSIRGGEVRLTVAENMLYGYATEAGEKYFFEPLHYLIENADPNLVISYAERDVKADPSVRCGSDELCDHGTYKGESTQTSSRGHCVIADIALGNDLTM